MYQFFVKPEQIVEKRVYITGKDVNHIGNVLRMKIGEELAVSNGEDGKEYRCGILSISEDEVVCEVRFIKEDAVELPCQISLFQGLPKADKMELIIQKAVELGAYEVIPVATKRAVVKLDAKKEKSKLVRWQGISEAAAKQSKRAVIPNVQSVKSFKEAILSVQEYDVKLIPYEMAEDMPKTRKIIKAIKPGSKIAIFIGPEGGFAEDEIQFALENNVVPITLGKRILRTETAGMTVLSILMYELEGQENTYNNDKC